MSILIVVTAFRHTNVLTAVALGLVLGGAVGNLTDRLTRGEDFFSGRVVDFIDLQIWPVFNIADTAIVVGAVILAVSSFVGDRDQAASGAALGGTASPATDGHAVDER